MIKIVLDTNIWIYLTKDKYHKLWLKLKAKKEAGEVEIIVNDVLILEWNRNKGETIKKLTASIKSEYLAAMKLANYLEAGIKEEFIKVVLAYKEEENRVNAAQKRVQNVEDFMLSCTIISTTEEQKLFVAESAIKKIPPFDNNKNNFNDALIVRNICEFVIAVGGDFRLIYASNNPDDFIDKKSGKVVGEILNGLEGVELVNVVDLAHALHLAEDFLTDDYAEWVNMALESEAMNMLDISRGK